MHENWSEPQLQICPPPSPIPGALHRSHHGDSEHSYDVLGGKRGEREGGIRKEREREGGIREREGGIGRGKREGGKGREGKGERGGGRHYIE